MCASNYAQIKTSHRVRQVLSGDVLAICDDTIMISNDVLAVCGEFSVLSGNVLILCSDTIVLSALMSLHYVMAPFVN